MVKHLSKGLMMRKMLGTLIVLALVLVGCGGEKDDTKADDNRQTGELIAPEKAGEYLLTLDDMPSGWSQEPEDTTEDEDPRILCLEGDTTPEAANSATVDFKADTFGPLVRHGVHMFSSIEDAQKEFAAYFSAVDQCQSWTETNEDGEEQMFQLSRMSFGQFADESFAIRMEMSVGQADVIYLRKDNMVQVILYLTLTIAGPQESLFQDMVEKAVGKLE